MTYLEKYNELITYRKNHLISGEIYSEKHHIKPKSLYPELKDDKNNIVRLTAAEHFKAHYYLWKHYLEETDDKNAAIKMHAPIMRMHKQIVEHITDENMNEVAIMFEEARIQQAEITRNRFKGVPCSEEVKRKISETEKGKVVSEETRKKIGIRSRGNKYALGHKMSEDSKAIMRKKLSAKFSGENNPAFGRHWYNDGIKNIYTYECPAGCVKGMLKNLTTVYY